MTIPGAVDAWCTLNAAYGTLPLADLLEPAARTAENGYIATPRVAYDWLLYQGRLQDPVTTTLFLPGGKPPNSGDRMRNPPLAETLRRIGREGRDGFYAGSVMQEIVARLKALGGLHEEEDLLEVEHTNPDSVIAELARRGHHIKMADPPLGGCQAIWIDNERSVLIGGADPRRDGIALGYLAASCLIPDFDGALFSVEWRDALWARFSTAAPRRQRRSVERYSIVKRA